MIDIDEDKDDWHSWKDEYWASRDAKRKEKLGICLDSLILEASAPAQRRKYNKNPKEYKKGLETKLKEAWEELNSYLQSGTVKKAKDSEAPEVQELQHIIDGLVQKNKLIETGKLKSSPELIIYLGHSREYAHYYPNETACVIFPQFIGTSARVADYLKDRPELSKYCMAHELAHIVNGDTGIEEQIKDITSLPNQKREVLAERMGAIIFGNPREYARLNNDVAMAPPGIEEERHIYDDKYLSNNAQARMLCKWADILEREGATDKETGDIIDMKIALDTYERSKEFADVLLKTDRALHRR